MALLLCSGAVIPLWRQSTGSAPALSDGDPLMQAILITVYSASLALLLLRCRGVLDALAGQRWLLAFLALVLASTLWSDAPELTARRGAALCATTVLGLYLGLRYSLREQIALAAVTFGVIAALSLAAGLLLPSYGISDEAYVGAWRGVFVHKNNLGRAMALACVLGRLELRRGERVFGGALMVLSALLIGLSQSRTSLVLCAALLASAQLGGVRSRTLRAALALAGAALVGGSLALLAPSEDVIFAALGRDSSLTGRTGLWQLAIDMIRERPFLGYGYAAFWRGWEGASAYVWALAGWEVPHAHCGYLDLCLGVGLIATAVLVCALLSTTARAFALDGPGGDERLWPLLFVLFLMLSNLTESALATQNSVFWVLYVAAAVAMPARAPASRAAGWEVAHDPA